MSTDSASITGEEKERYLTSLEYAVEKLGEKATEMGYTKVAEYCPQIKNLLKFFHYQRTPTQKFGINEFEGIIIDPSLSGFPNSESIRKLFGHKELAQEYLNRMPIEEEILKEAQKKFFKGQMPTQQQEQITQVNFYKQLTSTQLPERRETFFLPKGSLLTEGETKNQGYEILSMGLDTTKNLYLLYTAQIIKEEESLPAEKLAQFFDGSCFSWNPREVFLRLNSLEGIRPKTVERFVIGPFYFQRTENSKPLQQAFEKGENPWLLRFRKEHVESKKTVTLAEGTIFKKQVKKELCSEETREQYALCPPSLERALQELFVQEDEEYKIITVV
ncbi:hypothetical protein HY643_02015 [Candidatus Woesearchaeota archaeon]|nr:hypothetical protein [Candidatus Woesearchaeota archaeon]